MLPLLRIVFCTAVFATVAADQVVFSKQGVAALPTTYGYMVFNISADDVRTLYVNRSEAVFKAYERFVGSRLDLGLECLGISQSVGCRQSKERSNNNRTTYEQEVYWRELKAISLAINFTVEELVDHAFRHSPVLSSRVRRNVLEILTGFGTMVNFGVTMKNSWDLHNLKQEVQHERERTDRLFIEVGSLSRTQLRNQKMIGRLVKQVAR